MYDVVNYALVADANLPTKYRVVDKRLGGFLIIEDLKLAHEIVEQLLADGAEIFKNNVDFKEKYPPPTAQETKEMGMDFWIKNIPQENWPKEVLKYFEKKKNEL